MVRFIYNQIRLRHDLYVLCCIYYCHLIFLAFLLWLFSLYTPFLVEGVLGLKLPLPNLKEQRKITNSAFILLVPLETTKSRQTQCEATKYQSDKYASASGDLTLNVYNFSIASLKVNLCLIHDLT